MTGFDVLYYPKYEPSANWLLGTLLFYDSVKSIVPKDANYMPSKHVLEVVDYMPTAYGMIAPTHEDTEIRNEKLAKLTECFKIIETDIKKDIKEENKKTHSLAIGTKGNISIKGHTFLHNTKLFHEVKNKLIDTNLLDEELTDIVNKMANEKIYVVEENAADLIVSLIADKIAQKQGLSTLTDKDLDYTLNSFNAYNSLEKSFENKFRLASTVLKLQIPRNIGNLEIHEYVKLREKYSSLREKFQCEIIQIMDAQNVNWIHNEKELNNKIESVARSFSDEVERIKTSNIGSHVKKWAPIYIGGFTSLVAAAYPAIPVSLTSAAVGIGIQVYQNVSNVNNVNDDNVYRMIAKMNKDVLKRTRVRRIFK